jgi:hypothetical protein
MNKSDFPLWKQREISLISMYNGISLKGKPKQLESIQSLMLLDNLHDFSHNRSNSNKDITYNSRGIDSFCSGYDAKTQPPCIFEIIFKQLNKKSLPFSQFGKNTPIFTRDMFIKIGWEKALLKILIKSGATNLKWMPRKEFMNSFFAINCWSHDSMRKGHDLITNELTGLGTEEKGLITAHLDGCGGTCKTLKKTFDEAPNPISFHLPFPTGDEHVMYRYDPKKRILERKFPKKYGKGGVFNIANPKRECNCTPGDGTNYCVNIGGKNQCPYKRVDVLDDTLLPTSNSLTEDSIVIEGRELYQYLDHKYGSGKGVTFDDIEFFITAKCLSDLAQAAEAKQRKCFLITQDTMQMILGAKIGTRVIDYGNKIGSVFMSNEAMNGYIIDIQKKLKASGIPVFNSNQLSSDSIANYLKTFRRKVFYCLKCLVMVLVFFYTSHAINIPGKLKND